MKYSSLLFGIGLLVVSSLFIFQCNTIKTPNISLSESKTDTDCSSVKGLQRIICLAEAFKATLTPEQVAALQLPYSKTDAVKWSNFPQAFTRSKRVGLEFKTLNTIQLAAANALLGVVMAERVTNEGYDEMDGIRLADDFLAANGGGAIYSSGFYYMAFLGTPSTTGLWELQFGGHHYAFANTFNNGKIVGVTPAFLGVEPMTAFTANNRTYLPLEQERQAFADMLAGLSSSEQTTAKLSTTFRDILLGPGKDGQFPNTKQGLKVGELSAAKKKLVLNAIKLYVNDLDSETATQVLAKYTAEIESTYVAYSGTPTMNQQNDYVRVDGPSIWLEYSTQSGIVIRNTPHPHSVWRDRTGDYGGN